VALVKGPAESKHSHPPNQEGSEAEKLTVRMKRKAEEHPELRLAQLLRSELQGTSFFRKNVPVRTSSETLQKIHSRLQAINFKTFTQAKAHSTL